MAAVVRFDERRPIVPPDVLTILKKLKDELITIDDIVSVVLFGSYSRGTYGKNSDIDIAVFVRNPAAGRMLMIFRQAVRCAAKYKYDIQILIFTVSSLEKPIGIVEEIVEYGQDISFI